MSRILEGVISGIAARLQSHGFTRQNRRVLKKIVGNSAIVLEFQKSDQSSAGRIIFTVNMGLIRGELLESGEKDLRDADFLDAHLNRRLGRFLAEPSDKWWEVTASTEPESLAAELSDVLLREAIPYFQTYLDADSLIALWESGTSPGLTAVQRARYLHRLKEKQ